MPVRASFLCFLSITRFFLNFILFNNYFFSFCGICRLFFQDARASVRTGSYAPGNTVMAKFLDAPRRETEKMGYFKMHCNDVPTQFLDAPRRETEKVGYFKMHCNDVPTQFLDAPRR